MQPPSDHEAHVWLGRSDPSLAPSLLPLLNPAEIHRASGMLCPAKRSDFVCSHVALRWVLARYLATQPLTITFSCGPHGRPEIDNDPSLRFNLSHSRGVTALIVTREQACGIDVECLARPLDDRLAAPLLMTSEELRHYQAIAPAGRRPYWFALWVHKEAYLKARGWGLTVPPAGIAFRMDKMHVSDGWRFMLERDDQGWQFWGRALEPCHWVAGAVEASRPVRFCVYEFSDYKQGFMNNQAFKKEMPDVCQPAMARTFCVC